jgi:hypothetical protein
LAELPCAHADGMRGGKRRLQVPVKPSPGFLTLGPSPVCFAMTVLGCNLSDKF